MKGLHSGVFFLARNFITILLSVTGSKVNHLQINGFKIDTKKWATEINKIYVSFCWQENSQVTIEGLCTEPTYLGVHS